MELPVSSAEKLLSAYRNNNFELFKSIAPFKLIDLRVVKDYGASELKKNYQKNLARGLISSIVVCSVLLIGLPKYFTYISSSNESKSGEPIEKYPEFVPIAGLEALSGFMGSGNELDPAAGTPVPVPDNIPPGSTDSISSIRPPDPDNGNGEYGWDDGFNRPDPGLPIPPPPEEPPIIVAPPSEPERPDTADSNIEAPPSASRDVYIFDPWTTELSENEKQDRRLISDQLILIWRDLHRYLSQVRVVNENIIEIPIIRDNLGDCILVGRTNGQFRIKISSPRARSMSNTNILRRTLQVVLSF